MAARCLIDALVRVETISLLLPIARHEATITHRRVALSRHLQCTRRHAEYNASLSRLGLPDFAPLGAASAAASFMP